MKFLNMERFRNTIYYIQLMGILGEAEFVDRNNVPQKLFDALNQYEAISTCKLLSGLYNDNV